MADALAAPRRAGERPPLGGVVRGRIRPWHYVLIGAIVFLAAFAAGRFNMRYSAEALLRPQGVERSGNRLSGLAAQLGVALPAGTTGDPTRYYAELARSREVLGRLLADTFTVRSLADRPTSRTLREILGVKGHSAQDSLHRGIVQLRDAISVTPDLQTGLLRVQVVTPYPDLSYQLTLRLLDHLNDANTRVQQQQANVERNFVEGRLNAARMELEGAERELAAFESGNRALDGSPLLRLERARLTRRVDLRQQLFTTLAQQYEQTRIDAIRSTPVLVVVDGPNGSITTASHPARDAVLWAAVAVGFAWLLSALPELRARHFRDVIG